MADARTLSDEDIRTVWAQDRVAVPTAKVDDDDDDTDVTDVTDDADVADTDDDGDDA